MDDGSRTNRGVAGKIDVPDQTAAVANADVRANRAIGTDCYVVSDCGPGLDPSRRSIMPALMRLKA